MAVLKRAFKKFLEYFRSSSRTWDIFSVSCTQPGCLHNHSLWRNHGEIRSSCACLRKSAINVSDCIMEQTVHGRRLELLFHSLRNYRLILTCFSWLTFQLKALSTWERGSYSSDPFSGQLNLAAVTRTSLPSVALWLVWVSFCRLKERGFLKPMCRKEFLIHIYRVPATFKVFRHMKATQENGPRSWLWLAVYSWENHSAISPQFPQLGKKGNALHDLWNSILNPVWDAMYLSRALRLVRRLIQHGFLCLV